MKNIPVYDLGLSHEKYIKFQFKIKKKPFYQWLGQIRNMAKMSQLNSICVCWTIKLHNLLSTLHILWNQNRTAPHHVTLGADGLGLQLCSAPNFPALWTNPWTWSAARVDSVGKQEASILDQVGGWAIWFEVNLTKMFLVFCYCTCTIITHS